MSLNVLSLFAGIGGLELGLERAGMTVVGQVEIDDYCRRVLAKHWPNVPRHDDVKTAAAWWLSVVCDDCDGSGRNDDDADDCLSCSGSGNDRPDVDVICGGFPCQDISAAGRRAGIIDGERSSLWTYLAHTVRVLRPRYVLVENVAAILVRGVDVVAADLAEIGYDLRWDCVPAAAVGAPHRRDRWFGIAYPNADGFGRGSQRPRVDSRVGSTRLGAVRGGSAAESHVSDAQRDALRLQPVAEFGSCGAPFVAVDGAARDVADADSERQQRRTGIEWPAGWGQPAHRGQWSVEPDVGRVAHGVPARVDRLRALGNAVVPQVAEHVGRLIVAHDEASRAAA